MAQANLAKKIMSIRAPSAPGAPPALGEAARAAPAGSMAGQASMLQRAPASANDRRPNAPDRGITAKHTPGPQNTPPVMHSSGTTDRPAGTKPAPALYTDPEYWRNVVALKSEYLTETARTTAEQTLADIDYRNEVNRMDTDRERARRNLAESLLGRGSSIYSGMHRRDQIEGDTDHIRNRGRLSEDYDIANAARRAERFDIEQRLAEGVGDEWMLEAEAAAARGVAAELERGQSGEGDYSLTRKQRLRAANKQIKGLRTRLKKANNPKQRKRIQARIRKVRKRRDKLKGSNG